MWKNLVDESVENPLPRGISTDRVLFHQISVFIPLGFSTGFFLQKYGFSMTY
jgi:hypothetical protein